ncbi:hypothetical protein [Nocardiopsis sp. SBT366]|uniref:hypothetical protein n=1 Tax=Nocardiopsis sp. SBT366 TaxID=1580529 RepID=UPI000A6FFD40|nr:hypothetical protein [Nocardiopsis sp. SBT366]
MSGSQVSAQIRSVLTAPRGHRFPRTNARSPRPAVPALQSESAWTETHQDRQERLLRQMGDNPRVAYMLEHGPVPHWVRVARQHREQAAQKAAEAASLAEPEPVPPRGRHRAPRPWWGWPATAISSTLLLGLNALEILDQNLTQHTGILT